jgi:hypothetical protein
MNGTIDSLYQTIFTLAYVERFFSQKIGDERVESKNHNMKTTKESDQEIVLIHRL